MESVTEATEIVRELTIAARPETVWEFLVEPDQATRWMGIAATLDPRPGGVYRVEVIPDTIASGAFVEVVPPHRLVFTWGWEPGDGETYDVPPGSSTIEIRLVPEGTGTRLRFVHRDLPTAESSRTARARLGSLPSASRRRLAATPAATPGSAARCD